MKKLLMIFLSIALIFTMSAPVFAATPTSPLPDKFAELKAAGILDGDANGNMLDVASTMTRQQLAKIACTLSGVAGTPGVTIPAYANDYKLNVWGFDQGWIQAAYTNNLMIGKGAAGFDSQGKVSVAELLTVVLRSMGFKSELEASNKLWSTAAMELAVAKGLIQAGAVEADADATYGALVMQVWNAYTFNEAKNVFGITDVTARNLNQIVVQFNQEVDEASATAVTSYLIDGVPLTALTPNILNPTAGDALALQRDKKTVVITLDVPVAQYGKKLLTVVNGAVLSKNTLSSVPKFEKELIFSDVTVPTVSMVVASGNTTVVVAFSEGVKLSNAFVAAAGTSFKIDGQNLVNFGYNMAMAPGRNGSDYGSVINLMFSTPLPVGVHTLTIPAGATDLVDAAGFALAKTTFDFSVADITSAPTVSNIQGENNGTVLVTFSAAMDNNAITAGNYDIGGTVPTGAAFVADTDSKIVKLTFASGVVATGANVLVVKAGVKDKYGNLINSANVDQRYSFNATVDNVKPTVTNVNLIDNLNIRVKFSEAVNASYAQTISNYVLKNAGGINISGTITGIAAVSADTYTITVSTALTGSSYTLLVKNIVDRAAIPNVMVTHTSTIKGIDNVAPTLVEEIMVNASTVSVVFSEPMDPTTLTNRANLSYKDGSGAYRSLPSSAVVTVGAGNSSVKVTFPTGYTVKTTATVAVYDVASIRVANVKDAAGNVLAGIVADSNVVVPTAATVKPKYAVNTFKLYSDNTKVWAEFELTDTLTSLVAADFTVAGQAPDSAYLSGNKVVLNFTNAGKITAIKATAPTAPLATIATPASTNDSGVALTAIASTAVYDNQIKPQILSLVASDSAKTIAVKFSTPIDDTIFGLYADDFTFAVGGSVIYPTSVAVAGDTVTYTFAAADWVATSVYTLTANPAKASILDVADGGVGDQNAWVPSAVDVSGRTVTSS